MTVTTQNNWTDEELNHFKQNLRQVINWTSVLSEGFDHENGRFGWVFRNTNPTYKGVPLYRFAKQLVEIGVLDGSLDLGEDYSSWSDWDYSFEGYEQLLQKGIAVRNADTQVDLSQLDTLGRIISFETCISTHDGATIVESRNFVDEADVPPIDTWFFLKRNYFHLEHECGQSLFCWIPKKFEELMQQAINVEILDSYRWFDENDRSIYDQIKNSK